MKKTIKFISLGTLFIICAFTCKKEGQNKNFYIKNNFSKPICVRYSFAYPDTTLKKSDPNNYKINIGEEFIAPTKVFAYNSILQIFIFDADVIEKEPWDSIVAKYKILKRYQFTDQDLQNRNWTITYP